MSESTTTETETETTETTAPEATEPTKPTKGQTLDDLLADLDEDRRKVILDQVGKSRNEAKNLRERLKAAEPKVSEYDRLAAASKTDLERAQDEINQEKTRSGAVLQRLALAEIRAALAGVVDNPDAIAEDLNLSKFVDEDGEVDQDAIKALAQKFASFSAPRKPKPDTSQGSAGAGATTGDPAKAFASFMKTQTGQ